MGYTFRICAPGATYYSELVKQYGAPYVFRSETYFYRIFNMVLGKCLSGRDDRILFYPGTYITATGDGMPSTGIAITKQVTIAGATGNPADVIINMTGGDCTFATIAAAADGVQIRDMSFVLSDLTSNNLDLIIVNSGAVGVDIANCIFTGADKDGVCIDSEGDRLSVRNCRFEDIPVAVQSNGAYSKFVNNYFNSDNTGAVALELTAGNWCEIINNRFDLSGGTGDIGIKLANACLLGQCIDNTFHASCSDNISPGSSTMSFKGNQETGTTSVIAYVVT